MTKRVLIADDDLSMRRMILGVLKAFGVTETVEAVDGAEALAKADQGHFDLMILDWHMPDVTGLDVIKLIRKQGIDVPVLMVTGETDRSAVVEAIRAGVSDYLVKPFSQDALREKLEKLSGTGAVPEKATLYRAASVMDSNAITIHADATAAEAVALLLKNRISGLPVVDGRGRPVGMITEFRLIKVICRPEINELPVSELMTTHVVTVQEDTILSEVASLMEEHRIRRIPVVRYGVLVGVIARHDLLQYVTDNHEALREFLDKVAATAQG